MFTTLFLAVVFFAIGSQALPASQYNPAAVGLVKRGYYTTIPTSDGSWDGTNDINTDWYNTWPDTGVVREVEFLKLKHIVFLKLTKSLQYWLTVQNSTMAPDGYERLMLTFNGTYPGPTIEAGSYP